MSVKDDVRRARIKEAAIVWVLWFAALPVFVAAALWQRFNTRCQTGPSDSLNDR